MTKFGWTIVCGVVLLLVGVAAIVYAVFFSTPSYMNEHPEAIQEIILPPVDEAAATPTETQAATSTIIH
jgi:hypothetical protein